MTEQAEQTEQVRKEDDAEQSQDSFDALASKRLRYAAKKEACCVDEFALLSGSSSISLDEEVRSEDDLTQQNTVSTAIVDAIEEELQSVRDDKAFDLAVAVADPVSRKANKAQKADASVKAEVEKQRAVLLKRREVNLERKANLNFLRQNQLLSRSFTTSYFVRWPTESYAT